MKKLTLFFLLCNYLIQAQITPTNYSLSSNWLAGKMKGTSDFNVNPSYTLISKDTLTKTLITLPYDTLSNVDFFCIYPTTLPLGCGLSSSGASRIFPVNNICYKSAALAAFSIEFQQFGQLGRCYAPYYRQANLATFTEFNKGIQARIFDTVYTDVFAAFKYYMDNYNNGRKVIIVGHSQGSMVLGMLLRKLESNVSLQPYLNKIFLSVLIGMECGPYTLKTSLTGGWWQSVKVCQNPCDTGCVMSWGARLETSTFSSFPNNMQRNDTLVAKGLLYSKLDTTIHRTWMDPLNFSTKKFITRSVFPKVYITKNVAGVTTNFVAYDSIYKASISYPNANAYGLMIDTMPYTSTDKRFDPVSGSPNDLHIYDAYVASGDIIKMIKDKLNYTICIPTSLKNNNLNENAIIYPNPFTNRINIKNLTSNDHFILSNALGQTFYEGGNICDQNLTSLVSGIYFLSVKQNNTFNTFKLIKE